MIIVSDAYKLSDEDLLPENEKKVIENFIGILKKIYEQDINQDDCTVLKYKEFVPLFTVLGTLAAAQLDISQDEYYMIVDYHIKQLDLMVKEEMDVEE